MAGVRPLPPLIAAAAPVTAPSRITFPGSQGQVLAARLDRPAGQARASAVFAHCFTCTKDIHAAGRISGALTAAGFAVLRFDFTGLGGSEGDFANTHFSSNLDDLRHAAAWLRDELLAPGLLVGHSLGGAAVIAAGADIASVRAVATIGAPAAADHVTKLFTADLAAVREQGVAPVCIGGRPFTIRQEFVDDLHRHSVTERARRLDRALLVMHSPTDQVVGIENAGALFEAARHPKSFVSLDGADHLLSTGADATFAGTVIAAWAARYVGDA
jgi:putative redox protein